MDQKAFWNGRYSKEGKIWGDAPSNTAVYALIQFKKYPIQRILVPGAGYGRNTRLFSDAGYKVTGIEISDVALKLSNEFDPATTFFEMSALDLDKLEGKYDAIYCFNVLHLFMAEERESLIQKCLNSLENNGLLFFVVFSEKDESFGKGKEIEPNTFESKPGRPSHYFTEADLKAHFRKTRIIETGLVEEPETHGEGPHTHMLRYILCG